MPQTVFNAVEDFRYDSENSAYNRAYKHWRRHAPTSFAFRYRGGVNEVNYTEGRAAAPEDAAIAERRTLLHVSEMIGLGLLICLVTELFGGTLLVWLARLFGLDIRLDFLTFSMRGSQWAITAVRALRVSFKFGIPAVVMIRFLRLPAKVCAPVSMHGLPELVAAVGLAMLTAAAVTLADQSRGVELAQQIFEYKDSVAIMTYALFDVFIASALAELMLRGAILQGLRQFGDVFAVAVSAIIGFLLPNTLAGRFGEVLIAVCSSYLMIRGGSLTKCVVLRITYTTLIYARLITVYAASMLPMWSFLLLLISVGAIAMCYYVISRRDRLRLQNRRSFLPAAKKLFICSETVTTMPWLAASALVAVMQIFF